MRNLMLALGLVFFLAVGAPALADSVAVSGEAPFVGTVWSVNLIGDQGFSFVSRVYGDVLGIGFDPDGFSSPGSMISLRMDAGGSDLEGTATLRGLTYQVGLGFCPTRPNCASIHLQFQGSIVAPPLNQAKTVTLTSPVSFLGTFFYTDPTTLGSIEMLLANVVATLTENDFIPGHPIWQYASITYQLTPTPEPMSFLLLATAAGALGARPGWRWLSKRPVNPTFTPGT
jgi:hypothetical protein